MISDLLCNYSKRLQKAGLYRHRNQADASDFKLNFSSSDYLGLSVDNRVRKAFQKGFSKYPSGSGGSMVICGYHAIHKELETAFSTSLKADEALLFSSGFSANLSLVSLLSQLKAHIYIDKKIHASFYEGIKVNKSRYTRFLHNDPLNLHAKLSLEKANPVILTESVFSMTGQRAPLAELSHLAEQKKAALIVDEAHAFGVYGPQGLGAVLSHQLTQAEVPLRIIPLGKAFAFQGAMVVGQASWIEALLQAARSYIYSTGVSPALAYGLLETLTVIKDSDARRTKLFQLIAHFNQAVEQSSLSFRPSITPIQQLHLGCPHKALSFSEKLKQRGIFCQAMREPTVSKKETGLRILLNYRHEPEDINYLFSQLEQIYAAEY